VQSDVSDSIKSCLEASTRTSRHFSKIANKRPLHSSCLSVSLSLSPHGTTGLHWRDFQEILWWSIFRKPDKNSRPALCVKTCVHLWLYLAEFFLEWEMLQTKVVQKTKTQIIFSHFFFPKVLPLWHNVEKKYYRSTLATDDNTIRRKRIACWITKAADTPTEYATLTVFLQQKLLWKAPELYVLWASPVLCYHCVLSKVRPQLDKLSCVATVCCQTLERSWTNCLVVLPLCAVKR
jgi:hypothetical protein